MRYAEQGRERVDRRFQVLLHWVLTVAAVVTFAGGAGAESFSRWKVGIFDVAAVQGDHVTLRDIGEPAGSCSPEEWAELSLIPLWAAPAERGAHQRLTRQELAALLKTYLGPQSSLCRLPDQLLLRRGGRVVREGELVRLVANFLTTQAASWGGEPDVRDVRVPPYLFLDDVKDRLVCSTSSTPKPGHNSVRIQVVGPDDQVGKTLAVNGVLDVWTAVPVAARPLNRLEAVTPGDVSFARKNLAYLRHSVWDGKGGPWRVTSPVGRGEVIYGSNLERLPVVSQGDTVKLVFESLNLVLSVPARALEDADHGETIAVQNLQSNKQVYARVKDSQTVVVR